MKKSILKITLLTLVLFTSVAINAQRGERADPKAQANKTANTWQEKFGLSDDQHKKVYTLLVASSEKRTKKMQELRGSGNREGMRAAFTKMQEETDKGLKKIFTEAQWPMYLKWKKDNPPRRRGRRN